MSFNVGVTPTEKEKNMNNKIGPQIVNALEPEVVKASTYIEEKVLPRASAESLYSSPYAVINIATPAKEAVCPAGVGDILHFFG